MPVCTRTVIRSSTLQASTLQPSILQPSTLLLALTLLLASCSLQQERPTVELADGTPEGWPARLQNIYSLKHFTITGKIGVRTPEQSDSAIINRWQQNDDRYRISLSSAILGLGTTHFEGSSTELQITLSDGETLHSDSPNRLLRQQTGWSLPLQHIPYWVKGAPAPHANHHIQFDTKGHPYRIEQSGWVISPSRYKDIGKYLLPKKIVITDQEQTIKLIITGWDVSPP